MSRSLTAAALAAITAGEMRPILMFEGQFASGWVRIWTGIGTIIWGGNSWAGVGNLIGVSDIRETSDIVAQGVSITLNGVPSQNVALAIADAQQGLPGSIYIGFLDQAGTLIADPVVAAQGRLDEPTIADGADTCVISITYEGHLIDLGQAREFRYTHESQQQLFPGDLGFEYVAGLQDKTVNWG